MTRSRASRLSAGPFSRGDADHSKMVRVQAAALGPRRYGAAARASIVCCAAACAAASAAEPNASDPYDRSALYEELYSKLGYHANPTLSHGKELIALRVVPWFGNLSSRGLSARVLDVGCSHGLGVALLWSHGLYASGLDLSPTAVRMATTLRVPPEQAVANPWWPCGRDACFKVGSAAALPWANASFDAILTTDVLEHVPPPLVPSVAAEFSRVVQRGFGGGALFMAIALKEEVNKFGGHVLHESIRRAAWWSGVFEEAGPWKCEEHKAVCSPARPRSCLSTLWLECKRRPVRR